MTDARFPERWLNDRRLLRLPDDAFRLFVTSLAWSVANKTDGVLYDDDLALVPGADPRCHGHLVKQELWEREADYWVIADFEETQSTSADLALMADKRRKARDKKRRQRAAAETVPRDVPGDTTRPGQARPGQAPKTEGQGQSAASQSPKPGDHDASNSVADVDQQPPVEVLRQSQSADRYAREAAGTLPEDVGAALSANANCGSACGSGAFSPLPGSTRSTSPACRSEAAGVHDVYR